MITANSQPTYHTDFQAGQVLLLNKPLHWTSFDVVNKIRNILSKEFKTGRIKVGHAGTLDPLATGLLIICTGKLTKNISEYQNMEKEYTGTLTMGATTPSYDRETPVAEKFDIGHITEKSIQQTTEKFIGTITQFPPVYSARKINGERSYKKARRGENVKIQPNEVEVTEFEITGMKLPVIEFRIVCSKGTYIRSLVHDFGKALNNGAYLSSLCRTRIGEYRLQDAITINVLSRKESDYATSG